MGYVFGELFSLGALDIISVVDYLSTPLSRIIDLCEWTETWGFADGVKILS